MWPLCGRGLSAPPSFIACSTSNIICSFCLFSKKRDTLFKQVNEYCKHILSHDDAQYKPHKSLNIYAYSKKKIAFLLLHPRKSSTSFQIIQPNTASTATLHNPNATGRLELHCHTNLPVIFPQMVHFYFFLSSYSTSKLTPFLFFY